MKKIIVDNISLKFDTHQPGFSFKEIFSNFSERRFIHHSNKEFYSFKNISFSVSEGERIGIIGNNGAGKSSLLRTISRIYIPTDGTISVIGKVAPLLEIGAGFHPEFTGRENIYFNGAILGYSAEKLQKIEQEIIDFSELAEFIDTPVKYCSTGMHMRLAYSLATSIDPDILVLDELFVGGDEAFIKKGKQRLLDMVNRSNVMVLVSHDAKLLKSLCQRFIWLDHGRLIADGDSTVLQAYLRS